MTLDKSSFKLHKESKEKARAALKISLIKIIAGSFIGCVFFSSFCFFYFGSSWNPPQYIHKLSVSVLNVDSGVKISSNATLNLGAEVVKGFLAARSISGNNDSLFKWNILDNQHNGYESLIRSVDHQEHWLGFYIPPDFTAQILGSISPKRTTADQMRIYTNNITVIYDEGRQQNTVALLKRIIVPLQQKLTQKFSQQMLLGTFGPVNLTTADIHALSNPVPFAEVNIHPVKYVGEGFAAYVGSVVLWLGALFAVSVIQSSVLFVEGAYSSKAIVGAKLIVGFLLAILLSMSEMLIIITLGGGFEKGWFAFWMFSLLTCTTYMTIIGFLINVLGPLGLSVSSFLMILQISSTSAIYSNEVMNPFFRIGYGLPMYWAVEGNRYILFGSIHRIGRDVGILIAYNVIFLLANLIVSYKRTVQRVQEKKKSLNSVAPSLNHVADEENGQSVELSDHNERKEEDIVYTPRSDPIQNLGFSNYLVPAGPIANAIVDSFSPSEKL